MRFEFAWPVAVVLAGVGWCQGTLADYERGQALQAKTRRLVTRAPGAAIWIGKTDRFWYPRSVKGGTEFVLVDAAAGTKGPAFDHEKLAAGITIASGVSYTALTLPFAPATIRRPGPPPAPAVISDDGTSIEFGQAGVLWKCSLTSYICTKSAAAPDPAPPRSPYEEGGDPADGLEYP